MSATAVDLAAAGYTAREFYAEGLANRYTGATPNTFTTATVLDGGHPYRTRVMVRYPKPHKFNGTLAVEWTNVTIGVDFEFAAAEASEYLLREGYAVAVVSAQRVGVERLKTWSPQRYPGLSVDVNKCGADGTSLCTGDPLSFDIFAQITKALQENVGGANAPMPGLRVKDTIAIGQSQSAGRLATYYNTIQPLHDVFDGFAYWDRSGQLRSDLSRPGDQRQLRRARGLLRGCRMDDVGVHTQVGRRRLDARIALRRAVHRGDRAARPVDPGAQRAADHVLRVDRALLRQASALHHGGRRPGLQQGDRLGPQLDQEGEARRPLAGLRLSPTGTLVRDADGKVQGGIRLPQFVVPTAEQGALNGTAFPCAVSGWHRYYTRRELKAMYGTHGHYVVEGGQVMARLVADGYVLGADALAAVLDAARSDVGK